MFFKQVYNLRLRKYEKIPGKKNCRPKWKAILLSHKKIKVPITVYEWTRVETDGVLARSKKRHKRGSFIYCWFLWMEAPAPLSRALLRRDGCLPRSYQSTAPLPLPRSQDWVICEVSNTVKYCTVWFEIVLCKWLK